MPIETSVAHTRIKEQRRHPRAQLSLPVRLRWPTPLGQTTEVAETLDVCRGGLLIHRRDPCPIRALLWVTFPFDSTLPLTQPETPARIARVKTTPTGGHLVGIEFQAHHSHRNAGSAEEAHPQLARERRRRERVPLALPAALSPCCGLRRNPSPLSRRWCATPIRSTAARCTTKWFFRWHARSTASDCRCCVSISAAPE